MNDGLSKWHNITGMLGVLVTKYFFHYVILAVITCLIVIWCIRKKKAPAYLAVVLILLFDLYTLCSVKGATQYFYLWYGRPIEAYTHDIEILNYQEDKKCYSVRSSGEFINQFGNYDVPLNIYLYEKQKKNGYYISLEYYFSYSNKYILLLY